MTESPRCRRRVLCALLCALAVSPAASLAQEVIRFAAKGQVPAGYPSQYAALIAAAEQEGQLVVHSTTDLGIVAPVIEDFQAMYPRIEVIYRDMNSTDLYNGYLADVATSPTTADVLWSSAMDLQFRVASAGNAQPYDSPEAGAFPAWARWKNVAFGTTYEPVAVVYNARLLAAEEVPRTHADLARLLVEKRDRFMGKVVTYDIERSGLGLMLAVQDERASAGFWSLVAALGGTTAQTVATTEGMLTRVGSGTDLVAYNALGTYARAEAIRNPAVAFTHMNDYTLVVTRVMLIGKKAANPNAARLWVDYLLSKRGQGMLADRALLFSLREDVEGANSGAAAAKTLGSSARPIPLGPELIAPFPDAATRLAFIGKWQKAMAAQR
jgi:iron(III) transport system substrate-binding protein